MDTGGACFLIQIVHLRFSISNEWCSYYLQRGRGSRVSKSADSSKSLGNNENVSRGCNDGITSRNMSTSNRHSNFTIPLPRVVILWIYFPDSSSSGGRR